MIGTILASSSRLEVNVKLILTIYDTTHIGSYNWGLFTLTQLTSGIKCYKGQQDKTYITRLLLLLQVNIVYMEDGGPNELCVDDGQAC